MVHGKVGARRYILWNPRRRQMHGHTTKLRARSYHTMLECIPGSKMDALVRSGTLEGFFWTDGSPAYRRHLLDFLYYIRLVSRLSFLCRALTTLCDNVVPPSLDKGPSFPEGVSCCCVLSSRTIRPCTDKHCLYSIPENGRHNACV